DQLDPALIEEVPVPPDPNLPPAVPANEPAIPPPPPPAGIPGPLGQGGTEDPDVKGTGGSKPPPVSPERATTEMDPAHSLMVWWPARSYAPRPPPAPRRATDPRLPRRIRLLRPPRRAVGPGKNEPNAPVPQTPRDVAPWNNPKMNEPDPRR